MRQHLWQFAFAILTAAIATNLHAEIRYAITDLGSLDGVRTFGLALNSSGQVAGYAFEIRLDFTGGAPGDYRVGPYAIAFKNDTGWKLIGDGFARGINDLGQIAGDNDGSGFVYDGQLHNIGSLGGFYTNSSGINNSGQVTGLSYLAGNQVDHAFLFDGAMHDLGTLGGTYSSGSAINNYGQIAGTSQIAGNSIAHAFLYDGALHDLGTLGGTSSWGTAINSKGYVVGYSDLAGGLQHAFLYDGTIHDLGTLGGSISTASGINIDGQVVGSSYTTDDADQRPFVYDESNGMQDLNSLIDPQTNWSLSSADAINDAGQITGYGYVGQEVHAYLLTPVPEPTTFLSLSFGALVVALAKRKLPKISKLLGGRSGNSLIAKPILPSE